MFKWNTRKYKNDSETDRKTRAHKKVVLDRFNSQFWGITLFVGALIGIVVIDVTLLPVGASETQILCVILKWQGIIGGAAALLAAAVAIHAVAGQITSTELVDQRNCERELRSARAVLPMSLDALADYATEIAMATDKVLQLSSSPVIHIPASVMPKLPKMPTEVVNDLKAFIKAADNAEGEAVADIISDLQVISSNASTRWLNAINGGRNAPVRANFENLIGRSAVLYGRLTALFPYARRGQDHIDNLTEVQVKNALFVWFPAINAKYEKSALSALRYFQRRARETAPPQSPTTD